MAAQTPDFFRARLDAMIDLRHPLAVLATRLPWAALAATLSPLLQKAAREHEIPDHVDLLGAHGNTLVIAGASPAGRPRLPIRLMCSLLYLKHAFNLSDEQLCERWAENVVWQYFSGMDYYEPRLPCDATQIGRFRADMGESGLEAILKATIDAAVVMKAIKAAEFERVIVDTTVQEKAIAYPTDARLLEIARHHLVKAAKACGIRLRQTFAKEGKALRFKSGGYAHAKQFKRLKRVVKRQRTIVGILIREVRVKLGALVAATNTSASANTAAVAATGKALPLPSTPGTPSAIGPLTVLLERAERICTQTRHSKNKLYALHAPEVECISKGKARHRYEFGVKVSLAITHKQGLMVGAKRFTGNPFDGHTLKAQLTQSNGLIAASGKRVKQAVVDLGYRGVDQDNPDVEVMHRGRIKSMSEAEKTVLKRRQAVEPAIGHTKHDHGMLRCYLKGSIGDALHAISCAAGYNIRWLMRAIMRLGLKGLFALVFLVLARSSLRRFASTAGSIGLRIRSRQDHVTLPAYSAC
jgi:transposase, IS5 family